MGTATQGAPSPRRQTTDAEAPEPPREARAGRRLGRKQTQRPAAEAGPSSRQGGEGRGGRRCPATLVGIARKLGLFADAVKRAAEHEICFLPPE